MKVGREVILKRRLEVKLFWSEGWVWSCFEVKVGCEVLPKWRLGVKLGEGWAQSLLKWRMVWRIFFKTKCMVYIKVGFFFINERWVWRVCEFFLNMKAGREVLLNGKLGVRFFWRERVCWWSCSMFLKL